MLSREGIRVDVFVNVAIEISIDRAASRLRRTIFRSPGAV